jgi:two-component system, chemotaxis family, CheB/CheR fusion protein
MSLLNRDSRQTLMTQVETTPEFEALLTHIKLSRGFDFTGYKRSSLKRRIDKRMQNLHIENYDRYTDYLEVHPDEYTQLFNTILINVTSFFRDKTTWDFIAQDVLPIIAASVREDDVIRVWSAGCAMGQEAYTVAMILAEHLGVERFSERVKIYATDLDEDALQIARQASYTAKDITDVPEALLEKYFERNNGSYTFRKDLRRSIIFGRHDLVQDAPISRVDLLICRNTLMYFNSETQGRVLSRFHFALRNSGFLLLGKAEMLFSYAHLFTPFDLKRRIFAKMPKVTLRERLMMMSQSSAEEEDNTHLARYIRFRETAFDSSPVPQIVIDLNGFLVMANERARSLLKLSIEDVSRSLQDLEVVYRIPELRARIDEVYRERRPSLLKDIKWLTVSGDVRFLEAQIAPLIDNNTRLLGVSVAFIDMTAYHLLQEEIESANQELETAYEELQSTNEELETTNEELQSTVEELETTNEELQSTNEELETINEELQSTNEELQTMNDETNRRSEELNKLNTFLESILASMRGGVVVLNTHYQVQVWSHRAEDLWGLRSSEAAGKNFLSLDIGLPVQSLTGPVRTCLSGESNGEQMLVDAVNRRGKSIRCNVTCTPLVTPTASSIIGVILVIEEVDHTK